MTEERDSVKEGLESELAGLEAKLEGLDSEEASPQRARLERRIGEVKQALTNRRRSKTEKRPAGGATEKRSR